MSKDSRGNGVDIKMHVPPYAQLTGKVVMVTGASDGMGRVTALGLASAGATVVMVCRDPRRGHAAREAIVAGSRNPAVELMLADLSSPDCIRQLAADYKRAHDKLHILVNNAGVSTEQRILTVDGIELHFAVNHLAPFLLTQLLLDVLKASAPARIVNVASAAESMGKINFDDLMGEHTYTNTGAYAQSKLANVLFTYELARHLDGTGVTVNCLHPGFVKTKMTAQNVGGWGGILARVLRPFGLTPEQGAESILYLACSPDVQGVSGQYFKKKTQRQSSPRSYDTAVAQRLWQVSEQLVECTTDSRSRETIRGARS